MLCVETLHRRRASAIIRLVSCAFVHTMGFLSNAPVGTASSGCCGRLTQCLRLVSHFSQGCIGVFWTLRQPTRAPGQQTSLVINDCRRRLSVAGRERRCSESCLLASASTSDESLEASASARPVYHFLPIIPDSVIHPLKGMLSH